MTTLGERIRALPGAPRLFGSRAVAGARSTRDGGLTVWRTESAGQHPVIVLVTTQPATVGWLASVLAVDLEAVVAVVGVPASCDAASDLELDAAFEAAIGLEGADPDRIGVVGDGAAASAAMALCLRSSTPPLRLALVLPSFPHATPPVSAAGAGEQMLPPTLIQSSESHRDAAATRSLDAQLRAAGVAVRATEYTSVSDEWTRYPRFARGSTRARGDLVAFFQRGLGTESTFSVIPGWDLS